MTGLLTHMADFSILAQAAITWTPVTFYVAMGIVQTLVILIGFRIMQVDAENNTFIGAVLAAVVINVAAYFLRDAGLIGVLITGSLIFGLLVAITSGEVLKAFAMTLLVIGSFGAVGFFIVDRTPLTTDEIAGLPRVVMTGGLEAEPISEEDAKRLSEARGKSAD